MANIKIVVEGPLMDGHKVTFKAPCNCDVVDKLDVRHIKNGEQVSELFTMKDSHDNDLTGLGNLFAEGAYVDVVLDTVNKFAYLQNAATNGYIEKTKYGYKRILTNADNLDDILETGIYQYNASSVPQNAPYSYGSVVEVTRCNTDDGRIVQKIAGDGAAGRYKMRVKGSGVWHEWCDFGLLIEDDENPGCYYRHVNGIREWENPPMANGVVYRTTKRCMGKPVYVQCGDIGNLPNGTTITKSLGQSGHEFDRVIRLEIEAMNSAKQRYLFPMIKSTGISAYAFFDNSIRTLTIKSIDDNTSYQARYYIEYTVL